MNYKSSLEKAHVQTDCVFWELLPAHGLAVRPAQIKLCHEMLDAMFLGRIALCDAGVGIGKTYAYLVAGLLWQQYQPRCLSHTLTISTSSVTLQNAIIKEYLPRLSRVFVQDGLLAKPVRAVIRKGRERYACDQRLAARQEAVRPSGKVSERRKAALDALDRQIDMDEVAELSAFDRAQVAVPTGCPHGCENQHHCRYRDFLRKTKSMDVDIQICNHNYLLADAIHRQQERKPLLKDYHILIVDEAHKLPEAARQMYGKSIALRELIGLCTLLQQEHHPHTARQLRVAVKLLADHLGLAAERGECERAFSLTPEIQASLGIILSLLRQAARPSGNLSYGTIHQLEQAAETLSLFLDPDKMHILYIHYDACNPGREIDGITLCAANHAAPEQLAQDLWQTGRPTILTSGTLAAGGSFARIRQQLRLKQLARCREFTAPSPFDYERNCLLYFPKTEPGQDAGTKDAEAVAAQLRGLLQATYGHALVLFTSYVQMSEVCDRLRGTLPFPLLEASRGKLQTIQEFKRLPNAVLCAAGPCWEGVDFPGDMVSLLVIVRLPFPIPDPISEAERREYQNLHDYIQTSIVPQMQIKLRQGFGRAIRTETDSCVVAILDQRAKPGERYHDAVRQALPPCPVTGSLEDVEQFIRARKGPEYFKEKGETNGTKKKPAGVGLCARNRSTSQHRDPADVSATERSRADRAARGRYLTGHEQRVDA